MDRARAALRAARLLLCAAVCARSGLANDGIAAHRVTTGFGRATGPETRTDAVRATGGDVSDSYMLPSVVSAILSADAIAKLRASAPVRRVLCKSPGVLQRRKGLVHLIDGAAIDLRRTRPSPGPSLSTSAPWIKMRLSWISTFQATNGGTVPLTAYPSDRAGLELGWVGGLGARGLWPGVHAPLGQRRSAARPAEAVGACRRLDGRCQSIRFRALGVESLQAAIKGCGEDAVCAGERPSHPDPPAPGQS